MSALDTVAAAIEEGWQLSKTRPHRGQRLASHRRRRKGNTVMLR